MDGRRFPLHVLFEAMNDCENEYCRCTLIAIVDGLERPTRTVGAQWFQTLSDADRKRILGETRNLEYSNRKSLVELFA